MVDQKRSAAISALLVLIALSGPSPAQDRTSAAAEADRPDTFRPTSPADDRPTLPALTPTQPAPQATSLKGLEAKPAEPAAAAPDSRPVPARPAPARRLGPRSEDERLHQGLGWDYCGPKPGVTRVIPSSPLGSETQTPIDITADLVDYDQNADLIRLLGDVEILRDGRRFESDRSSYGRDNGDVKASGNIYLELPNIRLVGETADYNLETEKGSITKPGYRMSGNANLRGQAEQAWVLSEQRSRYSDIIYTTCPPGNSDWSIAARELELDQESGIGTARHARIRFADVPLLYAPYLSFPIDGRRRSGFLIPTLGSSEETGTDLSLPYYWNIAPNMDATIIPRYMSARGLMLGGQFRHLSSFQRFEIDGEILPNDQKAEDEGARGAYRIKQAGWLGSRWSTSVDYAAVSDDEYLQDFGNRLDVTSVRNLSQRADVRYRGDGWRVLGRLQQFQTVDASIAPASRPYGQLPHIELAVDPSTWGKRVELDFDAQYDYFDHNSAVHGSRLVAIPALRVPLRRSFGHLIPRARLYYTGYDLTGQDEDAPDQLSHLIPSLDIDGKLIFEREVDWRGTHALQTLEPRLYYVLTAYEDQADNPLFDTTALDFSFSSLFRPNRFTGYDRISDANRLTLGLTSRTIANRSGDELLRTSIGQIYYFDKRRVQLDGESDSAVNDVSSSLAGEISARLHRDWRATASLQWNPNETEQPWEKQVLQLRYAPDRDRLINLAYRYNLGTQESEEYEDTDLSFKMPLGSNVKLVGRWLYSMLNDETVEAFAGIEVGRCCWRVRVLGQQVKRSADEPASTSVMLQLELAGLGSFGNQIDKLLERGIYGYQSD